MIGDEGGRRDDLVGSMGFKRRTSSALSVVDEEVLMKRHRTRGALSKRQLTADTVLHFFQPAHDGSADNAGDDSEDEEEVKEEQTAHVHPAVSQIEIPTITILTAEELAMPCEAKRFPDERFDDEWYTQMHLRFEIKEQAIREQASRTGGRKIVRRQGPVSSTELLFAPELEKKMTKEDQLDVLGKVDLPEVPMDRLRDIEEKLEEVAKTYEPAKQFTRYYLHTQWKPEIVIQNPVASADGVVSKPKLTLKLKRLQDKF